jgi:hypothetical protein
MKKILFSIIFVGAGATIVFAQGLGFGIKGGVNIANTDISSDQFTLETKSKIGFHGGVFVNFMLSDKMGIQPELLYSLQGSEYDIPSVDGNLKLGYLNVPVLFRYNINDMFSIHAGPQFGFLMSAEEEFDGDTQDVKDDFKGSDISGAFGLEVDLPMKIGVGARYVLGFSNVLTDDGSFGDSKLKNNTIQIYVKFRLKSAN